MTKSIWDTFPKDRPANNICATCYHHRGTHVALKHNENRPCQVCPCTAFIPVGKSSETTKLFNPTRELP